MVARPATLFAGIDSKGQRQSLVELWRQHLNHCTRMRGGHAIVLSDAGFEVSRLVEILGIGRGTAVAWITRFNSGGVDALLVDDRPGGPRKPRRARAADYGTAAPPVSLERAEVIATLGEKASGAIRRKSLSRYAKTFTLSCKWFRWSLRGKRDEAVFRLAQNELVELLDGPRLDVVYFGGADFSLEGASPMVGRRPVNERMCQSPEPA